MPSRSRARGPLRAKKTTFLPSPQPMSSVPTREVKDFALSTNSISSGMIFMSLCPKFLLVVAAQACQATFDYTVERSLISLHMRLSSAFSEMYGRGAALKADEPPRATLRVVHCDPVTCFANKTIWPT